MQFRHTAYEMKKDILYLCHECGSQKAHLGGCLSAVDILNVLYTDVMNLSNPDIRTNRWHERDRFVMSKGHAGIAMYAALKQIGILSKNTFKKGIRGDESILFRHPKYNPDYAIECSVGSLGIGIGYAVGLAEVARLRHLNYNTYVMVGDGECNEGSVWESLAYASHRNLSNFIVIVDKNGLQLDGITADVLDMDNLTAKFKAFGFQTIEIDGHNYDDIYIAFCGIDRLKNKPLAIIADTKKGKGISFAENKVEWHDNYLSDKLYCQALSELEKEYSDAEKNYTVMSLSNIVNLHQTTDNTKKTVHLDCSDDEILHLDLLGCKDVVGYVSNKIANQNECFVLTFSDCANRIGIKSLQEYHPNQCFEMGIAEQNQLAVSAALALSGFDVFSVAYAPFITARVLDQVRALLGYMKSPVKLIGLTAGFAASDLGATHTALEDIANMRAIPNMTVICPADCLEISKAMLASIQYNTPIYIRITAPIESKSRVYENDYNFVIGKSIVLREGEDVVIIGCGSILTSVLECADTLSKDGISVRVINMHTIKPLDVNALDRLLGFKLIVTVEEHSVIGGLGSAVCEYLAQYSKHPRILKIGVPDSYYVADLPIKELERAGLIKDSIISRIKEKIEYYD